MFMLTFGIIAANLILIAIAFVVYPLLKKNTSADEIDRNTLNVAIYKERLSELDQENLTPEQLVQAKQELEKALAQDLDKSVPTVQKARVRWASAIIVTLGIPLLAIGGYWKLGAWQILMQAPLTETQNTGHAQNAGHATTGGADADFEKMVKNLAERLEKEPNDDQGWNMLARSYAYLKRYDEAAQAYNKALALVGEQDPELLTELARMLILSNGGHFEGQPTKLLKSALDLDPLNQQALWLLGLGADQAGDYTSAIGYWQRFLQQVPLDQEEARQKLEERIAQARSQLSNFHIPQQAEPSAQIEVHLSLDPALQDKVNPSDIVFIYARAITGSAMPLAIVKKSVSDLPITVMLDDSMAMMPALKLSNFKEVKVLARISRSGSAILQSGDLQGEVSSVILAQKVPVEIVINKIAP